MSIYKTAYSKTKLYNYLFHKAFQKGLLLFCLIFLIHHLKCRSEGVEESRHHIHPKPITSSASKAPHVHPASLVYQEICPFQLVAPFALHNVSSRVSPINACLAAIRLILKSVLNDSFFICYLYVTQQLGSLPSLNHDVAEPPGDGWLYLLPASIMG